MNETQQEESLDRQLREAAPYIDDAGFTVAVIAKLPAPRQKRVSLRGTILVGITMLGCALAYILSNGGSFIITSIGRVTTLPVLWLLAFAFASGILITAGGLVAAISKSREPQS
jgi:hypothetical protein